MYENEIHCVMASLSNSTYNMYKSRHWRAALNAICSARFLSQQRAAGSFISITRLFGTRTGLEPWSTLEFSDPTISDTKTLGTVGNRREPSYPPTSPAEYQISDPKSRIQNLGSKTSVTELPMCVPPGDNLTKLIRTTTQYPDKPTDLFCEERPMLVLSAQRVGCSQPRN